MARFGVATYGLFWSLLLPFGFATAASLGHPPSLAMVAPLFIVSIWIARSAFQVWAKRRDRQMQTLADEIAQVFKLEAMHGSIDGRVRVRAAAERESDVANAELEADDALHHPTEVTLMVTSAT